MSSKKKPKLPQKVQKSIQAYLQRLEADGLSMTKVILFGSYAKGKANKWSDIDLCVISPQFKDAWSALQYLWSKRIEDDGITIEPVGFSVKDFGEETSLTSEIKNSGVKLR